MEMVPTDLGLAKVSRDLDDRSRPGSGDSGDLRHRISGPLAGAVAQLVDW